MCRDDADEVAGVPLGRHHLMTAVLEQACQAFAQQHLILDDHDPHGSSAVRTVPSVGGLSIDNRPP